MTDAAAKLLAVEAPPTPAPDKSPPLAIDAHELARLLSVSHTTVHAMNAREELPTPLRFGRCLRWNRPEIERRMDAGAPPRHKWEAMKNKR